MNNSNFNMKDIMNMLSKVDKKDLENSIKKANEIMNSNNKDEIINEIKKKLSN